MTFYLLKKHYHLFATRNIINSFTHPPFGRTEIKHTLPLSNKQSESSGHVKKGFRGRRTGPHPNPGSSASTQLILVLIPGFQTVTQQGGSSGLRPATSLMTAPLPGQLGPSPFPLLRPPPQVYFCRLCSTHWTCQPRCNRRLRGGRRGPRPLLR